MYFSQQQKLIHVVLSRPLCFGQNSPAAQPDPLPSRVVDRGLDPPRNDGMVVGVRGRWSVKRRLVRCSLLSIQVVRRSLLFVTTHTRTRVVTIAYLSVLDHEIVQQNANDSYSIQQCVVLLVLRALTLILDHTCELVVAASPPRRRFAR